MISFTMPVYNAAPYLAQSIKSVLEQTIPDIELIIVNDGSTDSSETIITYFAEKDPRIRVYTQGNKGSASALNVGMSKAKGDILLIADADDIQLPERAQLYLDSMKEVDFAYSSYNYCSIKAVPQYIVHALPMTKEAIINNNGIPGASIGIKKEVLSKGLKYREDLRVNYDLGLIIDLYKLKLKYAVIDIPTFNYRVLSSGMSYSKKNEVDQITKELVSEL